jgi:small-conductance mechanosensitive channel
LLALKIRDLELELSAIKARTDAEAEDQMQIQEMLEQYDGILETLRAEYEGGLAEGINLPSYDDLTRQILAKQA